METLYIDTPAKLADLCRRFAGKPWLALDTEFLRETTYYPRLCLLQLASDDLAACVDPLALDDLSPLLELLHDPGVVKVFHAARQDLEIFLHRWGRIPTPLFDTQPAAALMGIGDQVGYGALVEHLLGIKLEKGHARTDWSRRPLDRQQLDYAYNDAIHLGEVYLKLRTALEHLGRLDWLESDFAELADPATYIVEPADAWKKVKGRQPLRGVQYAVLQRLAEWREQEAVTADRPRRRLLSDELMVDLARRMPQAREQIAHLRGMDERDLKRWGSRWLDLIEEGRQMPRELWPREKIPPKLSPQQEALTDVLSAVLRLIATERKLTPSAIASRKEIERLVAGDPASELLHGWRARIAGRDLQALLEGGASLELTGGELRLHGGGR
ncbi:MAG: ribonuclease D [Gammaproteobacteria bacterium]|nr:ribonuclease D [Gammaproteobacteria bacterium]MBU1655573.1 ribonuclease D [Gammaproteobacteria bacterium]MBU1960270.1 ribonuclease D [Gammaproteobacteria bacterium]